MSPRMRRSLSWTGIGVVAGMLFGAMNAGNDAALSISSISGGAMNGAFWGSVAAFVRNRMKT